MKHLAIVGPTASGKTALSIKLAKYFGAEIIAADSRTIYKTLNIGTAKPTNDEMQGIKHYCLDMVYPDQIYTAADFVKDATNAQNIINKKGKLDILVGGSGLYVDSFLYDYSFAIPNPELRAKYSKLSISELQTEIISLGLKMPINDKNPRHLISTLERGNNIIPEKKSLKNGTVIIGINPERNILKQRILSRAKQMIEDGVVEEVKRLVSTYGIEKAKFLGGPYAALCDYINLPLDIDEAAELQAKYDSRLAKRQITWFKRNPDIKWFNSADEAEAWCITIGSEYANN
jgi:tRNA dimethylallyltransferase